MKRTVSRLLVLGLATALCACGSRPEGTDSGREGQLIVSLQADTASKAVRPAAAAKSGAAAAVFDPMLLDDYTVDIYKDGQLYKNYPRFSDMPLSITLPEGNYELRAAKGSNLPAAWESPYYAGANKQIQIREGKPANATVTVSQANARVTVGFNAEGFPLLYDAYDAVLSTEYTGPDSLIFTPDETRAGYFMADESGTGLAITLRVVRKGTGIAYRIVPQQLPTIKPRHDMHITFNTDDASVTGIGSITVQVDDEVTEIPVTISVPGTMLPKPAPEITASGFTPGTVVTVTEGNTLDMATAVITARGRILSCRLSMPTNLGLKASYDLAALSAADSAALIAQGLRWTPNLKGKTRGEVNFQDIIANLPSAGESASSNTFALTVDDAVPITQTSNTLELKVNVNVPVFGLAMTAADGWARHAILRGTVTDGDPSRLRYQYNNGGTWTDIALVPTVDGPNATLRCDGLEPSTGYEVRATYGRHVSAPFTFTTETPGSLHNLGLDDWHVYELGTKIHNIRFYEPWANGTNGSDRWWNTNNDVTTSYQSGLITYSYKCFPAVSYVYDGYNGSSRAAEIRTTGWGGGNTSAGIDAKNKTAGLLYLWDGTDGSRNTHNGRAFGSRPSAMKFYYKYTPYNTDEFEGYVEVRNGSTVIGTGSFRAGSQTDTYTEAVAPIRYTDERSHATHIYIQFISTTKSSPETRTRYTIDLADGDSGWTTNTGSILRVDEISLEY